MSRRYGLRAAAEAGEVAGSPRRGLEAVALRADQPVQLADVLLEPVDARELLAAGARQHLALERVDLRSRSR